jgi:arylsulfatase A
MKLRVNLLVVTSLICLYSCKDFSSKNTKISKREVLPFQKPNVLVFMMDDMGYGDIRVLNPEGSGFLTPNFDQLIQDGVYFNQAHSADALCAPSRYSILTGNQVFRGRKTEGTWDNLTKSQIMPNQKTLADVLRTAGYATAFFGKSNFGGEFLRSDGKVA